MKGRQIMTGGNFLVTRENGFLSVVQNKNYRTEDGKQRSKIIMLLYGWEKAEEA